MNFFLIYTQWIIIIKICSEVKDKRNMLIKDGLGMTYNTKVTNQIKIYKIIVTKLKLNSNKD